MGCSNFVVIIAVNDSPGDIQPKLSSEIVNGRDSGGTGKY